MAPVGTKSAGHVTSTDAYVMYLQGRQEFRNWTPESIKKARKLFEQAAGLDPEYAPAYVGIADSVRLLAQGQEHYGDLDPSIASEVAKSNVDKALLRDPEVLKPTQRSATFLRCAARTTRRSLPMTRQSR